MTKQDEVADEYISDSQAGIPTAGSAWPNIVCATATTPSRKVKVDDDDEGMDSEEIQKVRQELKDSGFQPATGKQLRESAGEA